MSRQNSGDKELRRKRRRPLCGGLWMKEGSKDSSPKQREITAEVEICCENLALHRVTQTIGKNQVNWNGSVLPNEPRDISYTMASQIRCPYIFAMQPRCCLPFTNLPRTLVGISSSNVEFIYAPKDTHITRMLDVNWIENLTISTSNCVNASLNTSYRLFPMIIPPPSWC